MTSARLHGDGVQRKGIVIAGEQVGCQHLIVGRVVGLIQDAVIQPCAVGAGGEGSRPSNIGGDTVMPEETLQIHIGGVGNGDVVSHLISGQHRSVAALCDGNAQFSRLIIGGELNDLTGILQSYIKHLGGYLPIGGRGNLTNLIAGQRQGLTGSYAAGIGGNVVYNLAAAGIDDLIDSALQGVPGAVPVIALYSAAYL